MWGTFDYGGMPLGERTEVMLLRLCVQAFVLKWSIDRRCDRATISSPPGRFTQQQRVPTPLRCRAEANYVRLAETRYDNAETGCCARLDVDLWDEREFVWDKKPFLRDHVRAIFHIPLNFGTVMTKDHAAIEAAGAYPEQPVWLTDEVSSWGSDVYVAVDRDVPDADVEHLSGTFLTKVFEGPYRDIRKWIPAMEGYVRRKGRDVNKMYFYYANCPKCAKRFGANHVVLFAQVA